MLDQIPDGQTFEVIDPKAVVNIPMSTGFYNKMQEAIQHLAQNKESEEMEAVYEQIKSENVTDPFADTMRTMFILAKEFQQQANKAGFVTKKTKAELEKMLKEEYPEQNVEAAIPVTEQLKKTIKEDTDEKDEPAN